MRTLWMRSIRRGCVLVVTLLAVAPRSFADDKGVPGAEAAAREAAGGAIQRLSDEDVQRIAERVVQLLEDREKRSRSTAAGSAGPATPPAKPDSVAATAAPPAAASGLGGGASSDAPPVVQPALPWTTLPRGQTKVDLNEQYERDRAAARPGAFLGAPRRADLPPPSGSKETLFGSPLGLMFGGSGTAAGPADLKGGGRAVARPIGPERRSYLLRGGLEGGSADRGAEPVQVLPPAGPDYLTAKGHSAGSFQDYARHGEPSRTFLLAAETGSVATLRGGGSAGPRYFSTFADGRSLRGGGGAGAKDASDAKEVVPGWIALVAPAAKLSLTASSASNATFQDLEIGRGNPQRKGFSPDAIDVKNQLNIGSFFGNLTATYYDAPSGADSTVELLDAYGKVAYKSLESDLRERLVIRFGHSNLPLGFYSERDWSDWCWQDRPLVYGRLFNGNLVSMGLDVLFRPNVRDPRGDVGIWIGAANAQTETLPGFITSSAQNRVGFYPSSTDGRYSFADLLTFADAFGHVDLLHGRRQGLWLHGGAFGVHGPNGSGEDGDTWVYGARARLVYLADRCATKGRSDGLALEAEWLGRDYRADQPAAAPTMELTDSGGYVSLVLSLASGMRGLVTVAGRYDWLESSGENFAGSGSLTRLEDPMRSPRTRWSALVGWDPEKTLPVFGHFSFALQYSYDEADFLGEAKHSLLLGFQVR